MDANTQNVIGLLKPYDKRPQARAQTSNKFATMSYANKYDYLYNKYSDDKNFNMNLWRESIERGEQDTYLSLLEQNKGAELSKEFYDPAYYNYESMLLELYKENADSTTLEGRVKDFYDPTKDQFVQESIGQMSDKDYLQYQLDELRAARNAEITRDFENWRKEQMTFAEKLGADVLSTGMEFGEGVLAGAAGLIDLPLSFLAAGGRAIAGENYLDAFVDYIGQSGLYATEKNNVRTALDEYERLNSSFRDIDGNMTKVGQYVAGISNSIGMMVPAIITNIAIPGAGMYAFYGSVFIGNIYDNANNPYTKNSPSWLKVTNAALKTSAEAVVEVALGKFLGGTIGNRLLGLDGGLNSKIMSAIGKYTGVGYLAKSALQEGAEEFLQDMSTNFIDQFTALIDEGYGNTGVTFQTLVDSFLIGALSSVLMSGGAIAANAIKTKAMNKRVPGSGDLTIEQDGEVKPVKGLSKLYLQEVFNDFRSALDTLNTSKVQKGDIKLAQEVYNTLSILSQYYSSFDKERIKNAELLLNRVITAETYLPSEQIGLKRTFAETVLTDFNEMVENKEVREAVKKIVATNEQKIESTGAKNITGAIGKDNIIHTQKDDKYVELAKSILNTDRWTTLRKEYDWIFTTDGKEAVEIGDALFVPESWLQNYKTSDIYQFLVQEDLLNLIINEPRMEPMMNDLMDFYVEFTGDKSATREQALMDLLFNSSVYQGFLLTGRRPGATKYARYLFNLHEYMKAIVDGKTLKGKKGELRRRFFERVYTMIKSNMREPVIKAVLNWNMDPQSVNADTILTDKDKAFVKQYQTRKNIAKENLKAGKITQAYSNMTKVILQNSIVTPEGQNIVDRGLSDDATNEERLQAIAYLNIQNADVKYEGGSMPIIHVPLEAVSMADTALDTQKKSDVLNLFEKTYGVSAISLYNGDLSGMTIEGAQRLDNDMLELNVSDYSIFVEDKLNQMFGTDYIVTPKLTKEALITRRFIIAKKYKADELLSKQFIDGTKEESDKNFVNMFVPMGSSEFYKFFTADKNDFDKDFNVIDSQGNIIETSSVPLSSFVDVSDNSFSKLKDWRISYGNSFLFEGATRPDIKTIFISSRADDKVNSFVHELNHAIQTEYDMNLGGSPDLIKDIPGVIKYLKKTYHKLLIALFGTDYDDDNVAYLGYTMLQGELWSEHFMHNGKYVRGFTFLKEYDKAYLVSPDGKEKFEIDEKIWGTLFKVIPKSKTLPTTEVVENRLATAIDNILSARQEMEDYGFSDKVLNTMHTRLSRKTVMSLKQEILNPNASAYAKAFSAIDQIIKDPQAYLKPELLSELGNDLSEGRVYHFLKDYFEKLGESVSLDRDMNTHEYIFVDDDAADDLLKPEMLRRSKDTSSEGLADNLMDTTVPLDTFYTKDALQAMGVSNVMVEFIENNEENKRRQSETIVDQNNPNGKIILKVDRVTSDYELINKLNHEFRHVLQFLSKFELGFTPSFKVTPEMLVDIKAHVPEIFKSGRLYDIAMSERIDENGNSLPRLTKTQAEDLIARYFVYYMVHGEQLAYGIRSYLLNTKPAYVTYDGGKPTIFLPWYNAKTGEGKYTTDTLASLADDGIIRRPETEKGIEVPRVKKEPKAKETIKTYGPEAKTVYNYDKKDFNVSATKAKDNNLKYFYNKAKARGVRLQMDPRLQALVIATTGNENKLPDMLMRRIKDGTLTLQSFNKWFRNIKTMDDYTFNFVNNNYFHNDYIKSFTELKKLTEGITSQKYWALAVVLYKRGLDFDYLVEANSITKFNQFLATVKGTELEKEILETATKFTHIYMKDRKDYKYVDVDIPESMYGYMRLAYMQRFDGTLAGAMYVGNIMRDRLAREYVDKKDWGITVQDEKGKELEVKYTRLSEMDNVANDIIALYEYETAHSEVSVEKMVEALVRQRYEYVSRNIEKIASKAILSELREWLDNPSEAAKNLKAAETSDDKGRVKAYRLAKQKYATIMDEITNTINKLNALADVDQGAIIERYNRLVNAETVEAEASPSVSLVDKDGYKNSRINIVARIKRTASRLTRLIAEKNVSFSSLSKEVQDMFEYETFTNKKGKSIQALVLRPEVYSVGRGRKALSGQPSQKKFTDYIAKSNLLDKSQDYRQDITNILANDKLLRDEIAIVNSKIKETLTGIKADANVIKRAREQINTLARKSLDQKDYDKETKFVVRAPKEKRAKISTTKNTFVVNSTVDMPKSLKDIYDVSFTDMSETRVRFASVDESGRPLTYENDAEFKSALTREVNNWDTFYEINRERLQALTHNDVLDIIEFIGSGTFSTGEGYNKMAAFEIFTLGYIVDAARRNINNWNLSDKQISTIERLYELKASAYGSGLNAVRQMLKVIDPFKRVNQKWLSNYGIDEEAILPLETAITTMQLPGTREERLSRAQSVNDELVKLEGLMAEHDEELGKGFGKGWYEKLKSARFTFMLSSPMTWIRNQISNIALEGLNNVSDKLSEAIFKKKGYREGQWNLYKVQVLPEVKTFIDEYINSNPVFDALYDTSTKYDPRHGNKNATKELFTQMITSALEQKYAAKHKFDNETANRISMFVSRMISDKRFIKRATNNYFNKMLTLEVNAGKIDLSKGLSNEVLNLFAEAVIAANAEYMHKRSDVTKWIDNLRDISPVLHETLTWLQPFINSGMNWFFEGLKYTPIGLISSIYRATRLEQRIDRLSSLRAAGESVMDTRMTEYLVRRDIGKGGIGLVMLVTGIVLGITGVIKIEDDDDKMYIYVGDIKVDISDIFGMSSILVGAALTQIGKRSFEDILAEIVDMFSNGFVLNDLLERHKYDNNFYDVLLTQTESVLKSFVPQFVQLFIRAANNRKVKYSDGIMGTFERWLNSFVPTQPFGDIVVDPFTGEAKTKYAIPFFGELLKSGILGPRIFWSEVSEGEQFAGEYGIKKGELTGELTINGELYLLDKLELNKKYGQLNEQSLKRITSQSHYVKMSDGKYKTLPWTKLDKGQQENVMNRVFTENAKIAKIYIWTKEGHKYYAGDDMYKKLISLGVSSNVYRGDKDFVK